ncbi:MAG: ABC transporter permease [Actinomycetes bacterium]
MSGHGKDRLRQQALTGLTSVGIVALAGVAGALLILLAGRNPIETYGAILSGAGLGWFIPGQSASHYTQAAFGLQQTLGLLVPLVLLGFAVAIPYRAGLFNIGGQGQLIMGSIAAVWFGSAITGLPAPAHITLAVVMGAVLGALWAAIAGVLRAWLGTNEVIVTIMLNYIAIWVGSFLFGIGGPLQNEAQPTQPVSETVAESARIPVIWGSAALQGLHAGIFLVPIVVGVVWLVQHRTTVGFETAAVGSNVEASRYLGIPVSRRYVMAMVFGGALAGLAGAMEILGWQFRIATADLHASQLGFVGIAIALLGRNTPIGVVLSAFLFAVLINGSSNRNLDPSAFPPELASYLTLIGQGVIILLVSLNAERSLDFLRRRLARVLRRKVAS